MRKFGSWGVIYHVSIWFLERDSTMFQGRNEVPLLVSGLQIESFILSVFLSNANKTTKKQCFSSPMENVQILDESVGIRDIVCHR